MAKAAVFSVVLESPLKLEIGDQVTFEGKKLIVTKIRKVEYITSRLVSVLGNGKAF